MQEQQNGKLVTPLGDFNCQSFPILENNKYFITDEELDKLGKHELKWAKNENNEPILIPNDNSRELLVASATQEKAEILKWLADNDWKVNKIVLGEWLEDDERVVGYKSERAIKRARMDVLDLILNDETNEEVEEA